jgi:GNAT superfamily N-acetyltransferase
MAPFQVAWVSHVRRHAVNDIILRGHRPGDMGQVIHRQAALYHREYAWDVTFEAMLAEVAAGFIRNFDPDRERAFLAERDGRLLGSAFVMNGGEGVAKLRMVYVEPDARGTGLGRRLVRASIAFARHAGYRAMSLWTNDILHAARRIYEAEGFTLVSSEPHHSFGVDLVGQIWTLDLGPA